MPNSKRNSPRRDHALNLRRLRKFFRSAADHQVCPLCGSDLWQGACMNCESAPAQTEPDLVLDNA